MSNIKKTQTFNQEMANRLKSFSNLPPTYKGHTKEKNENDSNAIKKKSTLPSHFESSSSLRHSIPSMSFSTQARFETEKSQYNNSPMKDTKVYKKNNIPIKGTMGVSPRNSLLIKPNDAPSPQKYKLKSEFDDNIKNKKGYSIHEESTTNGKKNNAPGPGQYKGKDNWIHKDAPSLKHRPNFFIDDQIKGLTAVSPQKYKINYKSVEKNRYQGVGFGIGEKNNSLKKNKGPDVGSYNIPSQFNQKGKKLPIN